MQRSKNRTLGKRRFARRQTKKQWWRYMILLHSRQHELCDCIVAISFLRIHDRISRQRLEEVWAHVQSLVWSPSRSLLERLRNSQTKPKTKTWWASRCWYAHWGRSALNLVSNICRLTLCSREKCLFTVLVTFSRRACHFVRKQKRQTHPRSKCRQIYSAMRQLCEGPKMLQLRRPLVGRTSYCMPVPLEDARLSFMSTPAITQRICLRYMLLKNGSNKKIWNCPQLTEMGESMFSVPGDSVSSST